MNLQKFPVRLWKMSNLLHSRLYSQQTVNKLCATYLVLQKYWQRSNVVSDCHLRKKINISRGTNQYQWWAESWYIFWIFMIMDPFLFFRIGSFSHGFTILPNTDQYTIYLLQLFPKMSNPQKCLLWLTIENAFWKNVNKFFFDNLR